MVQRSDRTGRDNSGSINHNIRKGEGAASGCALILYMRAIKDGGAAVTLKGEKYRLLFTLNALDELQEKFGGYNKLNEVFDKNNPDWVKDTRWLLTLLINEGLQEEDEAASLLTEQQVGRMIHIGNLGEVQRAIYASFAEGTAGGGEDAGEGDREETGETGAGQGK